MKLPIKRMCYYSSNPLRLKRSAVLKKNMTIIRYFVGFSLVRSLSGTNNLKAIYYLSDTESNFI